MFIWTFFRKWSTELPYWMLRWHDIVYFISYVLYNSNYNNVYYPKVNTFLGIMKNQQQTKIGDQWQDNNISHVKFRAVF